MFSVLEMGAKVLVVNYKLLRNSDNGGLCPFFWQESLVFLDGLHGRILPSCLEFRLTPLPTTMPTTMLDTVVPRLLSCNTSGDCEVTGWLFELAPETTKAHLV